MPVISGVVMPAGLLGLVAAQRVAELFISRRHERALRARGAVEHGAAHYPFIVAVHAGWLAALALFVTAMTLMPKVAAGAGFWSLPIGAPMRGKAPTA